MSALGPTRDGHTPEPIEGEGSSVRSRGVQMMQLGEAMLSAATRLKQYDDGATGEKGRSIEQIKEKVGSSYEDLHLAGERYEAGGEVIRDYGQAVVTANLRIDLVLPDLEELWSAYQQALANADTAAEAHAGAPDDDPEAPPAPGQSKGDLLAALGAANAAAEDAKTAYLDRADAFDGAWSDWSEAYDHAKGALEDAVDDDLEDGWRDKLADIVEVIVDVLTVVGIALAVAALIIGGPIIGAIAAIVAVAALVGTLYLYSQGRATGKDVAFAVVGVIPFGKAATVLKGGKFIDPGTVTAFKQGFKGGILNGSGKVGSPVELLTGTVNGLIKANGRRPMLHNFLQFDPAGGVDALDVVLRHHGDFVVRNVMVPSYGGAGVASDGVGPTQP